MGCLLGEKKRKKKNPKNGCQPEDEVSSRIRSDLGGRAASGLLVLSSLAEPPDVAPHS